MVERRIAERRNGGLTEFTQAPAVELEDYGSNETRRSVSAIQHPCTDVSDKSIETLLGELELLKPSAASH